MTEDLNTKTKPQEESPGWFSRNKRSLIAGILCTAALFFTIWITSSDEKKKPKKAEVAESDSSGIENPLAREGEIHIVAKHANGTLIKMTLIHPEDGSDVYDIKEFNAYLSTSGDKLFQEGSLLNARGLQIGGNIPSTPTPLAKTVPHKAKGYDDISEAPRTQFLTKTLKKGTKDPENKKLQKFLNTLNYLIKTEGKGSPGNETDDFGPATSRALEDYKSNNREDIENFGTFVASGDVLDSATREYINYVLTENEEYQIALR